MSASPFRGAGQLVDGRVHEGRRHHETGRPGLASFFTNSATDDAPMAPSLTSVSTAGRRSYTTHVCPAHEAPDHVGAHPPEPIIPKLLALSSFTTNTKAARTSLFSPQAARFSMPRSTSEAGGHVRASAAQGRSPRSRAPGSPPRLGDLTMPKVYFWPSHVRWGSCKRDWRKRLAPGRPVEPPETGGARGKSGAESPKARLILIPAADARFLAGTSNLHRHVPAFFRHAQRNTFLKCHYIVTRKNHALSFAGTHIPLDALA